MPLDPIIAAAEARALALISSTPVASPGEQRDLAFRVDCDVVLPLVAPPPQDIAHRTDKVPVPGRDDVTVHVFTPDAADDTRPLGGYLFFFGGAFRQGGIHFPSVEALLRARASRARTVIVAPDYALAPEEPYPIALEQGAAVLAWMHDHAADLGFDPEALTIGGMSAGGDLAAVVALINRDAAGLPIRQQILEVPVSDLTGGHLSAEVAPQLGLDMAAMVPMMREMAANYLGGADPRTPAASPLFAPDLSGLPPAHVLVAEFDIFRGDGEAYAAALAEHGTPATLRTFPDMTHGSLAFTKDVAGAQEWQRAVVELLRA